MFTDRADLNTALKGSPSTCVSGRYLAVGIFVIHDGRRFYGVLTCRYIRNTVAPGVHHVWHIGDVDTAVGSKGYGRMLVEEFIKKHGLRFYLWCWDDSATRFWIHMANSLGLPIRQVGTTPWDTPAVLIEK